MSVLSLRNPYTPGSGISPPYLAGRDSQIESFENMLKSIEDGNVENRILVGLRGTGKSVLIDKFNKICVEKDFLPIRRLQFSTKHCDPEEFVKALKYDIKTSIESFSTLQKIKGKLKAVGSALKPKKVGVPELFYYEPAYDVSSNEPLEDHMKNYLITNWKIFASSKYKGVVFLFDEFHNIYDDTKKRWYVLSDFIGVLNEVQKAGCKYVAVFAGLPNLQLNISNARTYTERMFNMIELGNLSKEESKKAISKPLEKSGYNFSDSLIDVISNETGQYPFFIQFYCKELISNVNKQKISKEDYNQVKPIIIKQLENDFFDPRMERLAEDEQKVLFAMSKTTKIDIPIELIKKKADIKESGLSNYLKRLEQKGMIYNYKRGIYRFSLPLLREYLQRKETK